MQEQRMMKGTRRREGRSKNDRGKNEERNGDGGNGVSRKNIQEGKLILVQLSIRDVIAK
jgi:hypothetical protein